MMLKIKDIRLVLPVVITVSSLSVFLFLNTATSAFDYARIPGGQTKAQALDTSCYKNYWDERNSGNKNLKSVTNASAYNGFDWISATNTGSTDISVAYGSTSNINLKVNHLDYICAVSLNPGTNSLSTIDTRMKDPDARDGHDAPPAPWRGYENSPNRTFYGFGLYGLAVKAGSVGSIKAGSFTKGAQVISARSDVSRFWMISTGFIYKPPAGGLKTSQDVTIVATIRNINQYYYRKNPKFGWEISCSGKKWNDNAGSNPGSHDSLPNKWFTDQCGDQTLSMTFHITVPLSYRLTPTVALNDTTASVGDSKTVASTVSKAGSNTNATAWRVAKLIYAPKANLSINDKKAQTNTSENACDYFRSTNRDSCDGAFYSVDRSFSSASTLTNSTYTVEDLAVGSTVCFVNSVSKPTQNNSPVWSHSAMSCLVIGKKPQVQIWGGDLAVGKVFSGAPIVKSVQASTSTNAAGNKFGSWIEYGIFATGSVTGAASGSAYAGTTGLAKTTFCNASKLSFTLEAGDSSCIDGHAIGAYKANRSIPDIAASFPVTGSTPLLGTNDLSNQSIRGLYTASGNLTLNGGTIEKGRWLVLNAPGATVTINGDIRYTSDLLQSAGEIPQLVIIANKIIIKNNVTNVDAWLVANGPNGIIETCDVDSSNYALVGNNRLTVDKCNKPLTVNGPVMAKQLWLRRTFVTAAVTGGDPAEIFNLRPDAYLWALAQATGTGRIQTVYTTELPPRL